MADSPTTTPEARETAQAVSATAAKRALVVIAGAADPLGDATPLVQAETPALDRMARVGFAGRADLHARSSWEGFLALLGLDPGAASLGACCAAGLGLEVGPGECVYVADFVTVHDDGLHDPFGGRVDDPEATLLLEAVPAPAGTRFVRAVGHRNLALCGAEAVFNLSPCEMVGRLPDDVLPAESVPRSVFEVSHPVLAVHDVNTVRIDLGENPANALWLHGGGPAVAQLAPASAFGARVTLVGSGPATVGLARLLGWDVIRVDGDDQALAAAALDALSATDLVVVRSESVLDAALHGDAERKRDALSELDARLVAPLLGALEEQDSFLIAAAADTVYDTGARKTVGAPVPFALLGTTLRGESERAFNEQDCEQAAHPVPDGGAFAALLARTPHASSGA